MSLLSSVPVLMYHHVSPSAGMITVSPSNFESQLDWLKRNGYVSLTTAQFARYINGEDMPKRSVLITFDDGYLDNWVYAFPLLKKYGFNAVIFLVTSWVVDGPIRPQLLVEHPLNGAQDGERLPDTPGHHECERLVAAGASDKVVLRWSEIQEAASSGVFEFHSHTHTHTRWDKTDPSYKNTHIQRELAQSRETLQGRLGAVSEHFCWPQGYFDADYVRLAKEAGFKYLYTTQAFGQNTPGMDPANIYRFAVRDTHGASVGRRIKVAAHPVIGPIFNAFKRWKRARRVR